jgi:hypothetical protein
MFGGGFIGQMHQTNKQNREMLKKEKRKPFDKKDNIGRENEILIDDKKLTDQERETLIRAIKLESKKGERKKLLVLLISLVLTVVLLGLIYWTLADRFIEFWK